MFVVRCCLETQSFETLIKVIRKTSFHRFIIIWGVCTYTLQDDDRKREIVRWSSCWGTRNFLRCFFWNELLLSPVIAHPARKRCAHIVDDKKIPANNDRSFVGAFYMYTNDIASLQIDLTVSRLLMYLFDHI